MKKRVVWSLLGVALLTIVFFSLREEAVKIESEPKSEPKLKPKPTKAWNVEELKVDTPKSHKDKNSSIANKKPTVRIDGFAIMSIGDVVTFHSEARDEDGNISSYLWKEEGKILGIKPDLPLMLSTEGEHTITLRVTDNLGAMAKASIDIEVVAPYDKKVWYQHRHCHCKGLTYSYFNDEGNLTKEITDDKEGRTIKEFTYSDEGKLLSMHYKNYYDESHLIKETTTLYDKFGNEIEKFEKEKDYDELDNEKFISFRNRHKYNEKGKMVESSTEKNGVLERVEKQEYDENGKKHNFITEYYTQGLLTNKSIILYNYDEHGNLLNKIHQEHDVKSEITSVSYREEYRYNDAQKVLEKKVDNDGNGEIDEYSYYVYDDANRLLEERDKYNDESSEYLTFYTYSTEGLLLEEKTKSEGKMEDIKHYTYSKEGLLLQEERKSEGKIGTIKHYTYNSNGQKTSSSTDYDGDGLIDYASKIFYDSEGNRIREESYTDGVLSSFNVYNSKGKRVESNYNGRSTTFIYDEETGVLNHLVIKESSGQMSIKYYDETGELIKEVDENGKVFYAVDRR